MLVNKDQENNHHVHVEFADGAGSHAPFSGPVNESIFGRAQYHWNPPQRGFNAHMPEARNNVQELYQGGKADPDGPIVRKQIQASSDFELPAASVVVLRGKL
jgi:hypothetical protein